MMENKDTTQKMWAVLLHLGSNMWGKPGECHHYVQEQSIAYHDSLYCDMGVWHKVTEFLPQCGINTVLVDVGEAVLLDSHPELAVAGSLTKAEMKKELDRLRSLGLTPIPKFNFSCTHNGWLGKYNRMIGTKEYQQVCADIVDEMIDIFDKPEFFHLGFEEENVEYQKYYPVKIERSWRKKTDDALAVFEVCRRKGVRPWIWIDPRTMQGFGGVERFRENVSKDVLLSNWWYEDVYYAGESENAYTKLYRELDEWGYEQVPTCSTWTCFHNPRQTVKYCEKYLNKDLVKGYMTAPWLTTRPEYYNGLLADAHMFGQAKKQNKL
jgi:hypothetical protein